MLPGGPQPPAATGLRDALRGNRLVCGDRRLEFRGGKNWHSTYCRRPQCLILTTLSLGGDQLICGGERFKVRGCGLSWLGDLDKRPLCPAPSGPRCGLRSDRLICGDGRLELRGCVGNWLRGPDRGPLCPAPSGLRCEFGGDRLVCGGGSLELRDCGDN